MKHTPSLCFCLLALVFFCFPAGHSLASKSLEPDELVLAVHPYLPAVELHRRLSPFVKYLEKKTEKTIRLEICSSFKEHIEKVGEDRADVSFMGPQHYVMVTGRYGQKPILAGLEIKGASSFHVMYFVRRDSPITSLSQLVGRKVAFPGQGSTKGHILVPKDMLQQAGVSMDSLAQASFLGSHNNVAMAVLGGYYDAGVVKEEVYGKFQERGLRMLAKSSPIPEQLFVASPKLSPQLVTVLREALLGLKEVPGGPAILESIQPFTTDFVLVEESAFEEIRRMFSSSAGKAGKGR